MSYGTYFGLNTALRGLLAQQTSLDITSHNIANVNTEGYSRQRAELTATLPLSVPGFNSVIPGQVGTGVEVSSFQRLPCREGSGVSVKRYQPSEFSQTFEYQAAVAATAESSININTARRDRQRIYGFPQQDRGMR